MKGLLREALFFCDGGRSPDARNPAAFQGLSQRGSHLRESCGGQPQGIWAVSALELADDDGPVSHNGPPLVVCVFADFTIKSRSSIINI